MSELAERVARITPLIDSTALAQERVLADVAVAELQAQQKRLGSYSTQAQFALAALYDGADQRRWPVSASRLLWLAVAGVLATGLTTPAEAARRKPEPTLGALAGRSAPVDRSVTVQAAPEDAAASYEAFLRIDGADPALKAQALRRLGDLRLEQAAASSAAGDEIDPAAQARAREAIDAYQQLLSGYPDYTARDAVLYQVARAAEVAGDPAAAMAALDELVLRHPQGAHADEAQFRRGEVFFSAKRYDDAAQAYAAVLAFGPASAFRQQALYKRGWAEFKLGDDAASSRDFLALLDTVLVQDGLLRDPAVLTRPEQELSDDALRALSLMFAADEGAASLQAALAQRGPAPYESRLYRALGDLYVEKERYQDGAEVYRSFARRQPLDPEAPLLLGRATDAYAKAGLHRPGARVQAGTGRTVRAAQRVLGRRRAVASTRG